MTHTVTAISAFSDNYIWAISAIDNDNVILVDPGDASVCIDYITKNKLNLIAILITHHHNDHTGGIESLINFYQQQTKNTKPLDIYGPKNEKIPFCNHPLAHHDSVNFNELNLSLKVIELPGHTLGHIAYVNKDNNESNPNNMLFCGDTLFSGGCGRLFEGSAEQMATSLHKLSTLATNTQVYCAHEYTLANLKFALTIEPNNKLLQDYYQHVSSLREQNIASIPTSIAKEKQINPFLRAASAEIKKSAQTYTNKTLTNELEVFTAIRQWKDNF